MYFIGCQSTTEYFLKSSDRNSHSKFSFAHSVPQRPWRNWSALARSTLLAPIFVETSICVYCMHTQNSFHDLQNYKFVAT